MSDQRLASVSSQKRNFLSMAPTGIEVIALFAILVVSYFLRQGLPNVAIADPDSWGYLHPALSWMSDRGFQQTNGRDWLYPAMVGLFVKTTGSIAGIISWQQILGMLSVVFMAAAWRFWVALLPLNRWQQVPLVLVGLLPIYLQQANLGNIVFELVIRPEAVLNTFVYAQLACLLGYCKFRWKTPRPITSLILGGLAIFFAFATLSLKPSWLFAVVTTTAPVWFGLFGASLPLVARSGAPILGVFMTVALLWLPEKALYIKDSASRTFMPSTLLTIHADLIEKDLIRKIAEMPDSDPEKVRVVAVLNELQKELRKAEVVKHGYEKLGFDPDYLFYHCPFVDFVWVQTGRDPERFRSFCLKLYVDAALHNPLGFARKVIIQLTHFIFSEPSTFHRHRIDLQKLYDISLTSFNVSLIRDYPENVRALVDDHMAATAAMAEHPSVLKRKSFALDFSKFLSFWSLPLEIVFLAVLVVCLVVPSWTGWRLGGVAALVLFLAPAANAFTVSVAHALDLARYRYSYGGVLLFSLFAMAVYLALVLAFSLWPYIREPVLDRLKRLQPSRR